MTGIIISIGNELLIGDTVNTNASWLGRFLTGQGVEVLRIHTISDNLSIVRDTIEESLAAADIVISTGGLGPTHDDVTKKAVAMLFDADMVIHKPTLGFIKKIFEKRNIPFSKSNYEQAEVPANAEVLFNKQGTAPGLWFEEHDSLLAVLPGVPYEMKELINHKVRPKLEKLTGGNEKRYSRYLLTAGVGESTLSDTIIGNLDAYINDNLSVAYLPSPQGTRIRISGYGHSEDEVESHMQPVVDHIYDKASHLIVGEGKELTLSEALGDLLRNRELTLAIAESCTGGHIANSVTDIAGSSDYFLGGMVSYSNRAKVELLNVREDDLDKFGAVSKEVAMQMAQGVASRFNADYGISTTGIAGPGGGTEEKPVGTVWIGFWSKDDHFAVRALFTNDRLINKERSSAVALEIVRRKVRGINELPYDLKPQYP
ncbi:MAG: competence/damage-inducible protein A [Balneolaceae bacterium]|nr:competence/damage-inducible protein A [Balneolaceae bacterium]